MNEQLEERLKTLEGEYEQGKKMLAELEMREGALRNSLLRIAGAIQVLREFVPRDVPVAAEPSEASAVVAN